MKEKLTRRTEGYIPKLTYEALKLKEIMNVYKTIRSAN